MTDAAFTFEGCDSPTACRDGIRPLLGKGMTWSEVHCGRCNRQGIVVHADLDAAPADVEPAPPASPAAEPAKGRSKPAPVAEADPGSVETGAANADSDGGGR